MQRFPVEIWQNIGRDACLDGGYTGCSLSLVCRGMRDAMRRVRFISVAITNQQSCLAFAELVRQATHTPPCHHLFIWLLSATEQLAKAFLIDACTRILSYAAPTLITLSLHPSVLHGALEANISFPVLRDLCAPHRFTRHGPWLDAQMFPAVQRLHIVGSGSDGMRGGVEIWEGISRFSTLIAVRLTGVRREHKLGAFLRILLRAPAPRNKRRSLHDYGRLEEFAIGSPDAAWSLQIATQLQRLMYITIQPLSSVGHRWCGNGHTAHRNMVVSLAAIAEATSPRNTGSRRLWSIQSSTGYTLGQAQWDWLDVMSGGDGTWPLGSSHYATNCQSQFSPNAIE